MRSPKMHKDARFQVITAVVGWMNDIAADIYEQADRRLYWQLDGKNNRWVSMQIEIQCQLQIQDNVSV